MTMRNDAEMMAYARIMVAIDIVKQTSVAAPMYPMKDKAISMLEDLAGQMRESSEGVR